MYSLSAYGKMIVDRARMDAYVGALRRAIRPGSVVIDLGSGPGLFALIACQLGARRVFAIEPDNVIQIGREAAREHGFSDRIDFIQEMSTKVTLPERADVVVSDLRGVLPWFGCHLPSVVDARSRLLAPDGVMVPCVDRLWAAIVAAPKQYDDLVKPWNGNDTGASLNAGRNFAVNAWSKIRIKPEDLLSLPVCWYELDYRQITETNFSRDISFEITRRGMAHGLAVWFDAELIDGIGFSNAPGGEELIYGNAFFPFKEPVEVAVEDQINVRLGAQLIREDYVWRWDTSVSSRNETKTSFRQSTFLSIPLSPSQLRKRASTYTPAASDKGSITRFVLSQMDGRNSLAEIATELVKHFPLRFSNPNEALDVVAEISDKYSA
jgi:protein arginine N-methyltransferase 1